jgi:transposase
MYKSKKWAEKHLNHWIGMARRSRIRTLKQFAETLNRYRVGLLAHCKYPIHNGTLEGFNNKIKVLKRVAYGFHDDEYFILKIKQACSGVAYA